MWIRALENEYTFARPKPDRKDSFDHEPLEVRMFRVPEGEAILIIFPGNTVWLVDCGNTNNENGNRDLAKALKTYLETRPLLTLEVCVASHSHFDHIGALKTLLTSGSPALAPLVTVYRGKGAWHRKPANFLDRYHKMIKASNSVVERIFDGGAEEIVLIGNHAEAHFFVATGKSDYASLWMRLRYKSARLLFTGDVHEPYERRLIRQFSAGHFRADVLKVTHHGSSDGTSIESLAAAKPAFAITSSSLIDPRHRLEPDTEARILNTPVGKRRIFNTGSDGDIVVETDGETYHRGILYRVTQMKPGQFDQTLS